MKILMQRLSTTDIAQWISSLIHCVIAHIHWLTMMHADEVQTTLWYKKFRTCSMVSDNFNKYWSMFIILGTKIISTKNY